MRSKWRIKTGHGDIVATEGDALALVGGEVRAMADEELAECAAFLRPDSRCVRVLAAPGDLTVDGRAAPGGVAILDSQGSHVVRVGQTTLGISRVTFEKRLVAAGDSGTCAISGEPLREGDVALSCSCGIVALEKFARQLGDTCSRCGVRYLEEEDAVR